MNESTVEKIGWLASFMAIMMFASYLDQIRLNLNGQSGSIILPIATTLNCLAWIVYAWFKSKKDWPIFYCNALGFIVASVTTVTAVI